MVRWKFLTQVESEKHPIGGIIPAMQGKEAERGCITFGMFDLSPIH